MHHRFLQPQTRATTATGIALALGLVLVRGGESGSFTRDAAIVSALGGNLELRTAALEIDRAKARLRWAGRLPNPELELAGAVDQFGENEGEGGFEVAFSQRFPLTSRLAKEKAVRAQDVKLAEIEYEVRSRQLAYEVDKGWIELNAARRSTALRSRMLEVNNEISDFLKGRVEAGEVSSLDLTQVALNGQLLAQELGISRTSVESAAARLAQLIGLEPGSEVTTAGEPVFPAVAPPASADLPAALANRPDYAALRVAGDRGRAQLDLARAGRWDDIAIKLFAQREDSLDEPVGLDQNYFAGVGVSIPLPFRNRNQLAIDEAAIEIERANRSRSAMAFAIHSELRRVLDARAAAYRLVRSALGESVPLAEKNLADFQQAQQSGQASLLQVQRAQAQLLELETLALDLRENYELLDAEVRFLAGTYPTPARPADHPAK